jgi:hypothetical protein
MLGGKMRRATLNLFHITLVVNEQLKKNKLSYNRFIKNPLQQRVKKVLLIK